jgi:hypothetical protein
MTSGPTYQNDMTSTQRDVRCMPCLKEDEGMGVVVVGFQSTLARSLSHSHPDGGGDLPLGEWHFRW